MLYLFINNIISEYDDEFNINYQPEKETQQV